MASFDFFCRSGISGPAAGLGLALLMLPGLAHAGCNSGNLQDSSNITSPSCSAFSRGTNALAVGLYAQADGTNQISVGYEAGVSVARTGAIAIGTWAGSFEQGNYSTAVGGGTDSIVAPTARGIYSIAIGGGDRASRGASAAGNASVAIGNKSVATGSGFATAVGFNARANVGLGPTTVGTDSSATGTNAAAFGRFAGALAEDSTALGSAAAARAKGATSVGVLSAAEAGNSTAIGISARATKAGAVALGSGSIANVANTVSVGRSGAERRIMNVANGAAPTDAVNLRQVRAMLAALEARLAAQ